MKFYSNKDNRYYTADPCSVVTDRLNLYCTDDDSFPFILTDRGLVFGSFGEQHGDLTRKIRGRRVIIEGRYWIDSGVICVWGMTASLKCARTIELVQEIAAEIKKRIGGRKRMVFMFNTAVPDNEKHDHEYFVAEIPVAELGMCKSADYLNEFLWDEMNRQRKLSARTDTSSGSRDFWRHYEVVGETVKLNRSDLRYIVENIIREYHQGQQLMLPFDGNDEPYNYMQFVEWLENTGTYGKLPDCTGELDKIFNDENELYLIGVNDFYFGLGGEFDYESYDMFLDELEQSYRGSEPLFTDNRTTQDFEFTSVEDAEPCLTPEGLQFWKQAIIQRGREIADTWRQRITVNEHGLVYCERMIALDKLMGRHHEPEKYGNKDYYDTLNSSYEGIGFYWSWMEGGGCVYYENGYTSDVLVKAWVSPHDVDWGESTSLECADEQELRLKADAIVQIDAIETDIEDENGRMVKRNLPLKGSLLIGM